MIDRPITISSWPWAILHVDGDSFFASVEQALDPTLKNRAVVTGQERGIASAASLEAKKMGVTRGMPIATIRQKFPECVIVPGNYEAYTTFATRMFAIMRRYTPVVEEYSIDEAFADITGLRRYFNCDYKTIAARMQESIEKELDVTVSVGVSLSKSLAKLCSKFRKPHGLTCVQGKYIHILLQKTPVGKIWGIGHNTGEMLRKYGCRTAYDFALKPEQFIRSHLTKKELEIYRELRGEQVYPVVTTSKASYKTISKAKTFEPTASKDTVFAQLIKNIEEATAKCRRYKLAARKLIVLIKTQQFITYGRQAVLNRVSSSAFEVAEIARVLFEDCFESGRIYRSTTCVLADLAPESTMQMTIFDNRLAIEKMEALSESLDTINNKYGKGTIHIASSLPVRYRALQELRVPTLSIDV